MSGPEKYQFKTGSKCNPEQLELLVKCSKAKNIDEWNQYRKENTDVEIWLQGADLRNAYLEGANLNFASLEGAYLNEALLEGAYLTEALLEGADLCNAHLEDAHLNFASLEGARLCQAHLGGADLNFASLEGANLNMTHMECSNLSGANLEGAQFYRAHLEGASLFKAHLEGADFDAAHLEGAKFRGAIVDGATQIWRCNVDKETDFTGVDLDSANIEPILKPYLQYSRRRIEWKRWYKNGPWWHHFTMRPLAWLFWLTSDYGRSTPRIFACFFGLALLFAAVYFYGAAVASQPSEGLVANLGYVDGERVVGWWLLLLRSAYFSIVTMTTLGFGDMHANPDSYWGHVFLMLQVLLGYVLLGTIISRLAILSTTDGPAIIPQPARKKKK